MTWWSAVFATVVVAFPLMYRTARGAFESFDPTLAEAAATLGRSNIWIFWRVRMPVCTPGHPGGDCAGLCPGSGGVRCHLHDRRLHPRPHRHHLHHRLSALADRQRHRGPPLGAGEHGHLRCIPVGSEPAGSRARNGPEKGADGNGAFRGHPKGPGKFSSGGPV